MLATGDRARSATFTVTSTVDAVDATPGDGVCASAAAECTLRAAIQEANALPGPDVVEIPAGTYPQDLGGPAEDAGATGDLDITDDLVLDGTGATITGDGDRVFDIHGATTTVAMSGLTITHGHAVFGDDPGAGGIRAEGTLTLTDSLVTQNEACPQAGGIAAADLTLVRTTVSDNAAGCDPSDRYGNIVAQTLTMQDSVVSGGFSGYGGGANAATCVVIDSSITGNQAHYSGAGLSCGTLTMTRSRVSGNNGSLFGTAGVTATNAVIVDSEVSANSVSTTTAACAGIVATSLTLERSTVFGNGGGMSAGVCATGGSIADSAVVGNESYYGAGGLTVSGGTLRIVNSTISGNAGLFGGPGAISVESDGALDLSNVTITANESGSQQHDQTAGGGVVVKAGGTVHVRNSIIAGNVDRGGTIPDCSGTITSDGYDLVQDPTGCTIAGDAATVLTGVDPLLGPLAGGPTAVHALLAGSPAIDAGNPAGCVDGLGATITTDQRGIARPQGARCDLGAYESAPCGNGVLDPGEQCDHSCTNGEPDSCCSALCQLASPGLSCDDPAETCAVTTTTTSTSTSSTMSPASSSSTSSSTTSTTSSTTSTTAPSPADLTRALLHPDGPGARNTGSIALRGQFVATPPGHAFNASSGLTVRVRDGLHLDQTFTWTAQQCVPSRPRGIACRSQDRGVTGSFRPVRSTPGLTRFVVTFRRLPIRGPFQPGVTVDIAQGDGQAYERTVAACVNRKAGMACGAV